MSHHDEVIDRFAGNYFFLSNFFPAPISVRIHDRSFYFPTSEHMYQALKTEDLEIIAQFASPRLTAGEAKRLGKQIPLRSNWESIKDAVMEKVIDLKFDRHVDLSKKLLATGDKQLIEGNWWGDRYWGVCNGVGKNKLGQLLMQKRARLKLDMLLGQY